MKQTEPLPRRAVTLTARLFHRLFGPSWLRFVPARLRSVINVLAREGEVVVLGGVYHAKTVRDWINCVGSSGKVIVIEANPNSIQKLARELESHENVAFVSKAIWDKKCKLQFMASATDFQGWARVKDEAIGDYPIEYDSTAYDVEVEADSIDNIVDDLNVTRVDVIYLTINDSQIRAVDGISKIVRINKDLRIVIHSRTPYPANETAEKLKKMSMKVSIKTLLERPLKRPDIKKIVTIYACH